MTLIHDQKNNVVGYLLDQLIISVEDNKLMGIILGHCVYNEHATLIGIHFKEKIMDTTGETIAVLKSMRSNADKLSSVRHRLMAEGWAIIEKIKEHVCSRVEEKSVWSKRNFADVLAS